MSARSIISKWSKRDVLILAGGAPVFLVLCWLAKRDERPERLPSDAPAVATDAFTSELPAPKVVPHRERRNEFTEQLVTSAPATERKADLVIPDHYKTYDYQVDATTEAMAAAEAAPTTKTPASPPKSTFLSVGDTGELWLAGGYGVWLATTDGDWTDLIDAENAGAQGGPGAGSAIYRMAESGRARKYQNGTRIRVAKNAWASKFVEIIEGEDRGRSGWVQTEHVRHVEAPITRSKYLFMSANDIDGTKGRSEQLAREATNANIVAIERGKAGDPAKLAATKMRLAQNLERSGKTAGAIGFYRDVINQFPGTSQAKEAAEKVKALDGKQDR